MFDVFTGWKISVESVDPDASYIIVPEQQMAALCRLLTDHCIPHAVDGAVPTRHHAEAQSAPVVQLGLAVEVTQVQIILDLAP
jgi:hypothetical protein